jgi:hypothetical protein
MTSKKVKPFRISYYDASEIQDNRAPVRSTLVFATDSDIAVSKVIQPQRTILNVYPFYRKFKEPKRKTWIIVSGPNSLATKEVLKDLSGMLGYDSHERTFDTFKPNHPSKVDAYEKPLEVVPANENTCRWHGSDYMVDGRCTKSDPAILTATEPEWKESTAVEESTATLETHAEFQQFPANPVKVVFPGEIEDTTCTTDAELLTCGAATTASCQGAAITFIQSGSEGKSNLSKTFLRILIPLAIILSLALVFVGLAVYHH